MKRPLAALVLVLVAVPASAEVVFTNLGTSAPPATLGPFTVQPFDQAAQAAIPNGTSVTAIPGSPIGGTLGTSAPVSKRTIGTGWGTWSHGYTGAVYWTGGPTSVTLTPPAGAGAFYLYAEPNPFSWVDITVTTNDGGSSGPISVYGGSGANGFGFHCTAGEAITSVAVSSSADFAVGEFGIAEAQLVTAEVSIAKTASSPYVLAGGPVEFTIVVANQGPDGITSATVDDTFPTGLVSVTWTCTAQGGATCSASGSGDIADTVDLPSGGSVTYLATATADPELQGEIENTATVTLPQGVSDPTPGDHSSSVLLRVINQVPALDGPGLAMLAALLAAAGAWLAQRRAV